jgi:hypothetical protein
MSLACALCALATPGEATAQEESRFAGPGYWRLVVSPYTYHFRYSEEHRYVWAVGAERQGDNGWLYGGSYFSNSFGQPSAYAYVGERYDDVLNTDALFFQWSAGLMYGYKGKFKNKVPLNYNGFSPGAVVSLGWTLDRQNSVQANLLGDAGVMLQFSHGWR